MRSAQALRVAAGGRTDDAAEMLGLLSLIVWALTITVTVKYIFFVTGPTTRAKAARCR